MTKNNVVSRFIFNASLIAVAVAVPTVASFAYAATYAYVNRSGEVSTVTANDGMSAIMTAPNIAEHSGVMLLDSADDNQMIGDDVSGV